LQAFAVAAVACLSQSVAERAWAGEGASSNYFPGAYGSLLVAVPPEPGPVLADLNLFYSAEADRALLQERATIGVEVDAFYNLVRGHYD
jgi:hypothetical protein